jgi:hypothetical protein
MGLENKSCITCAWRVDCQKRFSAITDMSNNVWCADYTRDLSLKEGHVFLMERVGIT